MTKDETIEAEALLETAILAARSAGALVHEKIGDDIEIRHKDVGMQNLVTEMDHASEVLIKEMIASRHPGAIFLAEESGGNEELTELTWVIDPIDGTVNYAHGIPIYCISIGAVRDNEPVVGVIYNPNTEELFAATRGGGAYLNGVRLSVSKTTDFRDAILVTGFPYNVADNPFGCIDSFIDFMMMGVPVRRLGSAALDLAYTAAGRFEAYWEVALNAWDVAAGILMVTEAGGRVTSYKEKCGPATYGPCPLIIDRMLASNGVIHEEVEKVLLRRGDLRNRQ